MMCAIARKSAPANTYTAATLINETISKSAACKMFLSKRSAAAAAIAILEKR